MVSKPNMAKGTAVWLIDNTTLTFRQIADFCGMHELEVQGIADDEIAVNVIGADPVAGNQLDPEEISRGERDPDYSIKLKESPEFEGEERRHGPRYTPLSKRQDRPSAILWLLKNHPELTYAQISKLVGTTKSTILAVQDRTHWNIANLQPNDPVALGLCRQVELDRAVQKAIERKEKEKETLVEEPGTVILSTDESLKSESDLKLMFQELEGFTLDSKD